MIPPCSLAIIYQATLETFNAGLIKVRTLPVTQMAEAQRDVNRASEESLRLIDMLVKRCEKHGITLHRLKQKCIEVTFEMNTRKALDYLWNWYQSRTLLQTLQKVLISDFLLRKCEVQSIELDVDISFEDYQQCLEMIGGYLVSVLVIKRHSKFV